MIIRSVARAVVPRRLRSIAWKLKERWDDKIYSRLPLQKKFSAIYRSNVWGVAEDGEFYSGAGSDDAVTREYVTAVTELIRREGIRSVVDVGCGDFRVGRQLLAANPDITYVGIDIVPALIEHHLEVYQTPQVQFRCANVVSDPLPSGDLLLIRQVLQHLSNANISRVLRKVTSYRFVLASDGHPPNEQPHPNEDLIDGPDVRPGGLFLEHPPFSVSASTILSTSVSYPDGRPMQTIRSVLFS